MPIIFTETENVIDSEKYCSNYHNLKNVWNRDGDCDGNGNGNGNGNDNSNDKNNNSRNGNGNGNGNSDGKGNRINHG